MTTKSETAPTKSITRSPIKIAEEAIGAKDGSTDSLPPSIDLSPDINNEVSRGIQKSILNKIQNNQLETALMMSERMAKEEKNKLSESNRSSVSPSVTPSPSLPLGVLQPGHVSERAALLRAALDSLESDEAKTSFIREHPELLSPGIQPVAAGSISSPVISSPAASPQPSLTDGMTILMSAIELGMKMVQPQQNAAQSQPSSIMDQMKLLETFREISDKNAEAYRGVIDNMRQQQADQAIKYQEMLDKSRADTASYQEKMMNLQIDLVNRDKEYLQMRNDELLQLATRPPGIPVDQFKQMMDQARNNGIPVQMDSVEQERARAQIKIEERKVDHSLKLEERRLQIEEDREKRRGMALGAVATLVSGALGAQRLKSHQLSSAGSNVAGRF